MRKKIPSILLMILGMNLLFCLEMKAQLNQARREMMLYNYSKAIPLLEKAFNKGDSAQKQQSAYLLGECLRKQNNICAAAKWYRKSLDLGSGDPKNYFWIACCLRAEGDYPAARAMFLKYDSLAKGDIIGRANAAFCDSALRWQDMKPTYLAWNAGSINSPKSDFGPVYAEGRLFFTSDRNTSGKEPEYGWTGNPFLRICEAEMKPTDSCRYSFGAIVPGPPSFNREFHAGPLCFNLMADEVFITITIGNRDPGRKDSARVRTHLLKIVRSVKMKNGWSEPEDFFLNSPDYSVGHPSLSADGNTLYFVSDMEGGCGGTDIWCCSRLQGKWSIPRNAGKNINTPGNEMFPYLSSSGKLYFASDGHPGFGGLDIFVSENRREGWETPKNLGKPLNSSYDDFGLTFFPWDGCGAFCSNRPGGTGSDDIYLFSPRPPEKPATVMPPAVTGRKEPLPPSLSIGKAYRIRNIYYDFDKWNIRKDAEHSLDSLLLIMKEYPVRVEIGSHTDCRGSGPYNLVLSEKRAESVVNFLVSKGIERDRLTFKGYGKTRLVNGCDCSSGRKCSEEMHQENRRTEFTITGYYENTSSAP